MGEPRRAGPRVVALGGGHGLAAVLHALRCYAGEITAVVSVADDGGSSGRLRRDLGVPAPGDLRRALVALAPGDGADGAIWSRVLEHRFGSGELRGHAAGNLLIVALAEVLGDFGAALDEASRLVGTVGRVLPASSEPVVLRADVEGREVEGQVAVQNSRGRIRRIGLVPAEPRVGAEVPAALATADQVVLAPGSLFTSLLPVVCVPAIRSALRATAGTVVQVGNLGSQIPETQGLDATDHLRVVLDHGARVDAYVYEEGGELAFDPEAARALGVDPVAAEVRDAGGVVHDPGRLAAVLRALL